MTSSPIWFRSTYRFVLAAAAFLAALGFARAADKPVGEFAYSLPVPAGNLALKDVHDVVLKASIGRSWTVKDDSEDRVVVYLNHRKNEATVTYLISPEKIDVYCEGYATNGKGVRKGPEQPTGWLKYLKQDITKGLDAAAFLEKK